MSGETETTYIEVPEPALRALLDLAIDSMDFGSGFWEQEDTDAAREVAELLGVCPNAATPTEMLSKYPECAGIVKLPHRHPAFRNLPVTMKHEEHAA